MNWTYEHITDKAVEQINRLMAGAEEREGEEARLFRQWAYGAYLLWDNLTIGWRNVGDGDRLLALTEHGRKENQSA